MAGVKLLMNKYRYLLKNIGLLTIGNFATKILSFFLVPLYTSVLTTNEYGTYDLLNTTVSVLIPILTLNTADFALRFSLEKKYDQNAVVTTGARITLVGSAILLFALVINNIFNLIPMVHRYSFFFFLMFFSQALSGIMMSYARGTDHVASLSVSSVISSVITIACNIIFLIPLRMGLPGYFWANIIGPLFQSVYLVIRMKSWRDIRINGQYGKQRREMLRYSMPMIANSISWWVNNVSDRYMVTWFCGIAANGIYSVSTKIPAILNVFQGIFDQAWALSAVKDFDSKDESGFFTVTYNTYNGLMVIVCAFIIAFDRIMARFLYADNFYVAWRYVPFLTISIVFGAMAGYIGGFFTAVKESKTFAISTTIGAIANIILNFILIPFIGALGAALATAISYIIIWLIRLLQSKKYIVLRLNLLRDCVSYMLLFVQALVLLILPETLIMYLIQFGLISIILILYKNNIYKVIHDLIKK